MHVLVHDKYELIDKAGETQYDFKLCVECIDNKIQIISHMNKVNLDLPKS